MLRNGLFKFPKLWSVMKIIILSCAQKKRCLALTTKSNLCRAAADLQEHRHIERQIYDVVRFLHIAAAQDDGTAYSVRESPDGRIK